MRPLQLPVGFCLSGILKEVLRVERKSVSASFSEVKCYFIKTFFCFHLLSSDIIHTPLTSQEEEIGQKERQGNIINFLSVCLTFVSLNLFIYLFSSFNAECNLTLHYPEGL